jgi:hypothetical protein
VIRHAPRFATAILAAGFVLLLASMMVSPGDNDGLQGLPFLVLGLPWSLFVPEVLPFDEGRPLIAVLALCTALNGYLLLLAWSGIRRRRVRA